MHLKNVNKVWIFFILLLRRKQQLDAMTVESFLGARNTLAFSSINNDGDDNNDDDDDDDDDDNDN